MKADFDLAHTPSMRQSIPIVSRVLILVLAAAASVFAQANPDWTEPFPPFHIAGNLYYVGSKGLANYLVTAPQGNILINSDLEANVPMIEESIEKLGFKFKDTKILLISHAHWDHDAGSALIKEVTGATYMVMDVDVPVVESGGKTDFEYGNSPISLYRPTRVDRVLHDDDEVRLGGAVLDSLRITDRGRTQHFGTQRVETGYRPCNHSSISKIDLGQSITPFGGIRPNAVNPE
jgi:metallo-beta-lactamase class B